MGMQIRHRSDGLPLPTIGAKFNMIIQRTVCCCHGYMQVHTNISSEVEQARTQAQQLSEQVLALQSRQFDAGTSADVATMQAALEQHAAAASVVQQELASSQSLCASLQAQLEQTRIELEDATASQQSLQAEVARLQAGMQQGSHNSGTTQPVMDLLGDIVMEQPASAGLPEQGCQETDVASLTERIRSLEQEAAEAQATANHAIAEKMASERTFSAK